MRLIATATLLGCLLPFPAAEVIQIHEWGTFTSLQDEHGSTIGGLNTDEERLPAFVHDLQPVAMGKDSDFAPALIKGLSACNPTVTMRLETPVVYVHLPPGQEQATFDLAVEFRGGFLSQFYPLADATVDGAPLRWFETELRVGEERLLASGKTSSLSFGKKWSPPDLTAGTTSTLTWRDIIVGGSSKAPATTSPVWLAPRNVEAANLTVGSEHERYLFYRGLGHINAPYTAVRSADGATLTVSPRSDLHDEALKNNLPTLWLADLRSDGTAAFRRIPRIGIYRESPSASVASSTFSAQFTSADYSDARLATLRQELHSELMAYGLFSDEAQALLTTWEASYFKAAGQRLFFLVSPSWTKHVLPMHVSVPAQVIRAMMGRIELVSPAQRQALNRIAAGPVSDRTWFSRFIDERIFTEVKGKIVYRPGGEVMFKRVFVDKERGVFEELKTIIPEDYQAYLSLGRFRDALVWDAQRRTPDPELAKFLRTYVLTWAPNGWQAEVLAGTPVATLSSP